MFQLECFLIFKHIWDDDTQVYILQGADSPGRSESLVLTNRHCAASHLEPMMMGKKAGEKLKKQTLQSRTWLENLLCRIWVDDSPLKRPFDNSELVMLLQASRRRMRLKLPLRAPSRRPGKWPVDPCLLLNVAEKMFVLYQPSKTTRLSL